MKITTATQTQMQSVRDAGKATKAGAEAAGVDSKDLAASGTKDLAATANAKDLARVNDFLQAFSDLKLRSADTCGNYNYA